METNVKVEDHKVEKALQLFPYFDTWNSKTITDCCRLSRIKVVPPDGIVLDRRKDVKSGYQRSHRNSVMEVIHSISSTAWSMVGCNKEIEDLGETDSEEQESAGVHFIIEGTCKLIEHLRLVQKRGPNHAMKYSVFTDNNAGRKVSAGNEPKYSSLLFNKDKTVSSENESEHTREEKTDEEQCEESEVAVTNEIHYAIDESRCLREEENPKERPSKTEVKKPAEFFQFYRRMLPYMSANKRILRETSCRVESHFLQIALVHKGCCLGLGENLRNRYLVSVTKVTCLVVPLQFLLQHNPNNIWNRIKQFLNDFLPNEERILAEFDMNKKWNEWKRKFTTCRGVKCSTKMSDVPMSVRLSDANMRLDLFQRMFLQLP